MALLNRPYAYTKLSFDDPDEVEHRRAQFLIYKVLQRADHTKRCNRPSWLRVKVLRLKIKIGKRLKKLRKRLSSTVFLAKAGLCKNVARVLRSCKHLLHGKQGPVVRPTLPVF